MPGARYGVEHVKRGAISILTKILQYDLRKQ